MKKIGLVGGIGPASTVDYYLGIINKIGDLCGEDVYPEIVIDSVDMHEATEYFVNGQSEKSAALMLRSITNLQRAGAEVAAITANTEHIVWNLMKDKFPIPVISIVDAVIDEAVAGSYGKILIFGTEFTMNSGLYEKAFREKGIIPVLPSDEDRVTIGNIIYPNLENGIIIPKDKEKIIILADKYISKTSAEALLLGCTELPLIIKEGDISVPVINSTKAHINMIARNII